MKLYITGILMALVLLFAGCAKEEETAEFVINPESETELELNEDMFFIMEDWKADLENHWLESEDGEITDLEAHEMEDSYCVICGAETYENEDGGKDLAVFNEYGECIQYISYDAEGNVVYDMSLEYEYDEEGYLTGQKMYLSGVLYSEGKYIMDEEGYPYLAEETEYCDDGTTIGYVYDVYGEMLEQNYYDTDGNLVFETRFEYEYDEEGYKTSGKYYEDNILVEEIVYALEEDELLGYLNYRSSSTVYIDDGTTVGYTYDSAGNVLEEIYYDTEGNAVDTYTYEYEYDEEGNLVFERVYHNGELDQEISYDE